MKERGELIKNTVVTTVMSNFGLDKALEKEGILCERTAVGDRHVFDHIMRKGYSLGGEQSGHIIFSKYACAGDGVLTALKMMEIMIKKKSRLSALTAYMVSFPQVLKNIPTKNKEKLATAGPLQEEVKRMALVLGNKGRVFLRASGTEPLVRILVEAEERSVCERCAATLEELAKKLEEE
jgi:phosphoglucosamine mutase